MSESHNIEYKESWRDEYLKWISGFANAFGGRIYLGINDHGEVVGVSNSKKMMEDIPNKIVNYLGIVADVNLLRKNSKEFTNAGLSAPVFEAIMGGIMITIERGIKDSITPGEKAIVTENVTENRLVLIMNEIKINPYISHNQLCKILDVTRMTVYRDIEKLKDKGRIKRIGQAKGGHWEVIQK